MGKSKRLDGITHLTAEQKAERDARAQYWMNQRKIERVAEAALSSGWFIFKAADVEDYLEDGNSTIDDNGNLVFVVPKDGHYRIEWHRFETDDYIVRKIFSFPKEKD